VVMELARELRLNTSRSSGDLDLNLQVFVEFQFRSRLGLVF